MIDPDRTEAARSSAGPHPSIRFSAVLPTYQRAHLIGAAIESVLAQLHPATEVLVVDDGSTDETEAVVRAFPAPVRYLRQENAGAGAARNLGVREATSEWVAFLDSDDFWTEEHLQRMAAAIVATEGRAVFYFADLRRSSRFQGALQWELANFRIEGAYELRDPGDAWMTLPRQPCMLQASVFRREALLGVGGISTALEVREDTHLFFLLGLDAPICAVAGLGARMSDRGGDERLTVLVEAASSQDLRCTKFLYQDLLQRLPGLSRGVRAVLESRLADARLSLASRMWKKGLRQEASLEFFGGAATCPRALLRRIGTRLGLPEKPPV